MIFISVTRCPTWNETLLLILFHPLIYIFNGFAFKNAFYFIFNLFFVFVFTMYSALRHFLKNVLAALTPAFGIYKVNLILQNVSHILRV